MRAQHLRSPTPRVWLPSLWCQHLPPARASLNSSHSWGSPSKALLLPSDRNTLSSTSSAPALPYKTLSSFVPTLQRFAPTEKAVPLYCTRTINPGQGQLLSWAFPPLGRSPLSGSVKSISLSHRPLSLLERNNLSIPTPMNLRVLPEENRPPPLRDAGPSGVSHHLHPPPFQAVNPLRTIFSSRSPKNLTAF
jgi:hypothetical protein